MKIIDKSKILKAHHSNKMEMKFYTVRSIHKVETAWARETIKKEAKIKNDTYKKHSWFKGLSYK